MIRVTSGERFPPPPVRGQMLPEMFTLITKNTIKLRKNYKNMIKEDRKNC